MNRAFHFLAAGTLIATTPAANAQPVEAEAAALHTIIESVGTLADQGLFDKLEELFAQQVAVDYSSLSGDPETTVTSSDLMTGWASTLPGFDRTRHAISDVNVTIAGDVAIGSASVSAGHWLGSDYWQADGNYDYSFAKSEEGWEITSITFNLTAEVGSRVILAAASSKAVEEPADYIVRQQTRAAVLAFLTGLENKDMETVNALWADNAVQEMPYVPKGFPSRIVGKEALIRQYAGWPENSGAANFTDELVFYPMRDPETVFVEYRGVSEIVPTGRTYDQRYGGFFRVRDGKIELFREYFDPRVFAHAFGLEEGGEFFSD